MLTEKDCAVIRYALFFLACWMKEREEVVVDIERHLEREVSPAEVLSLIPLFLPEEEETSAIYVCDLLTANRMEI